MVEISSATFVSILISGKAISQCGLPCMDYFIWGDDYEYTRRLTTYYGPAYIVGGSVAIHKRIGAKALSLDTEDNPNRIALYRYYYRNNFINLRFYNKNYPVVRSYIKGLLKGAQYFTKGKFVKGKTVIMGYTQGIRQYHEFKSYILGQLKE